ncbi:hypothetical protein GALL_239780 [mine drainage metagenome]|uniref:Uncharacterized protein n=1 Tax=mine drainage metagenome TaxID=410659 RepID=A0A1J5RE82_9ZZZZ
MLVHRNPVHRIRLTLAATFAVAALLVGNVAHATTLVFPVLAPVFSKLETSLHKRPVVTDLAFLLGLIVLVMMAYAARHIAFTLNRLFGRQRHPYQTIGAGVQLVDFYSTDASLAVRHWLGSNWGVSAMLERYRNPYYVRQGVTLGLFWQL